MINMDFPVNIAKVGQLADNFVAAAKELMAKTGAFSLQFDNNHNRFVAHLREGDFSRLFKDSEINVERSTSPDYPVRKSILLNGIEFFCVSDPIRYI
ncbi:MAG: hypothetical protein ACOY46_14085 [Bacillota bacterium]